MMTGCLRMVFLIPSSGALGPKKLGRTSNMATFAT